MKKLITTNITTDVGMPIKSGTLDHLQASYQEALSALAISNIGNNYDADKVYILWGCVNSGTGSSYIISEGAVFYNTEVFLVPSATFTAVGTAVANISTTYFSGTNADPVEFTDASIHNVHSIRQMVIANGVSGSGVSDFANFISNKWVSVSGTSLVSINQGTGSISACYTRYKKIQDTIVFNFIVAGTISTYSSSTFTLFIDLPMNAAVVGVNDSINSIGLATINTVANPTILGLGIINFGSFTNSHLAVTLKGSTTNTFTFDGQITYPL